MMKALSVIELAQLYGMNRQSIYKRINKGDLSKNSDGSTSVQKETEVDMLKQQVDILKKQLELAHEREIFQREQLEAKDNQIEAIQRLLEAPKTNMTMFTDQKPSQDIATDSRSEPEPKHDGLTTPEQTENKRIPVPEHIEQEPEKRGFWSRFFRPYD